MKYGKSIICIIIILALLAINVLLVRQNKQMTARLGTFQQTDTFSWDKEIYEQMMRDNSENYGAKVTGAEATFSTRSLVFRYNEGMCLKCMHQAMALLESVFTKPVLREKMLFVSSTDMSNVLPSYQCTVFGGTLTPLDHNSEPYLCFVDERGVVLFSLVLRPADYEWNKRVLLMYKDKLLGSGKTTAGK